ncbi:MULTISPECIES: hypothetical protein [Cyanophyceae]|uniref:hypothetical protein n=1 Tax=Cyanophyceae TaxID=3028117 RepID=UPI001682ABDF|nr:hypothetical protein [Trichocoleus sp. FACHB-40]MBD2006017.1 hypothetical protein [Trichocoleus sp. FACHB-40]
MPRVKGVSAAGDDNLKKRWNFSLTQIARDGIGRLFKFWGYRDASALLEALGKGEIFLSKDPPTLASLLAAKDLIEVHELSDIPLRRLKEFLAGALPTVNELMDLEDALEVSQENLMQICGYPEKNVDNQDEPPENS